MRKLIVLLLIGLLPLLLANCGGPKKSDLGEEKKDTTTVKPIIEEPTPPPPPVDTTPVIEKIDESEFRVVYYDFDKFNLVDSAKSALEYNARLMKKNKMMIVKIEGHCDERGTVEYNLSLGEKRAASARDYLKELGIPAGNIQIVSYGKSRPVDTRDNEAAWAKNRRAQFRILSQ